MGAFTRDWIEQMTASVSNIVDRPNDVTDAIFEVQETSLALQTQIAEIADTGGG